jgi:hypothetical protein
MRTGLDLVWILVAVFFTFAVHEVAHGLMGAALGYDMEVRINGAEPVNPAGMTPVARDVITAAGPAITLVQGFAAAYLASITGWAAAFQVAAAALMMRVLAAGASLRMANDEARLGLSWDLGYWTVHVAVIGALALCMLWAARAARPSAGRFLFSILGIGAAMILVVVLERQFPAIVLQGMR